MKEVSGFVNIVRRTMKKIQYLSRVSSIRNTCIALLLFFVFMCLYMSLYGELVFVDEVEVFQNGYLISKGQILYKNVISQHMPFSYYIAAFISLFNPRNSYDYRVGFYLFLTMILIAMYFRHRRYISPIALIFGPTFFLIILPYYSLASSMLSDHWQGIGIGILLLEMLRYLKIKRITIGTSIWVSLGIQLSFGSAFLAAYAILPIMLAVFAMQINDYFRTSVETRPEYLRQLIREDLTLVGIVLLPMAVIILFYIFTGNFGNMIKGAYLLNTEVYSKYIGGFGSNPISAAIAPIKTFVAICKHAPKQFLMNPFDLLNAVNLLMMLSTIIIPLWLAWKKHYAAAIAWLLASIMCGIRGFDGFHSMPYFFVSSLSVGLVFSWCIFHMYEHKNILLGTTAIVMMCLIAYKLPTQFQQTKNVIDGMPKDNKRKEVIDTILEKGEPIHITDITQMSYVFDFQRTTDFGAAISTPWTYEVYGKQELESLQTVCPKVVFYNPGGETWGYNHDVYGKDLVFYIISHYTRFEKSDMWIRNDYVNEAMKKLGIKGTNLYLCDEIVENYVNITEAGTCIEYFKPDHDMSILGMGLNTANYQDTSKGTIGVEIRNEDNDTVVYQTVLDTTEFIDCFYNRFDIDSLNLKCGITYSIRVYMDNDNDGSLGLALIADKNRSRNSIEAYSNYKNGIEWDYGIYLVEKRSAAQHNAQLRRRQFEKKKT